MSAPEDTPSSHAQLSRRAKLQNGLLPGFLGSALRRAERAVFRAIQRVLENSNITPGELGILLLILENEGLNQAGLGNAIGSDRSSVVGLIDRLEHASLVRREPSLLDRRSHALSLTPQGAALVKRLLPKVAAQERSLASRLTQAEQQQLIELLGRIGG